MSKREDKPETPRCSRSRGLTAVAGNDSASLLRGPHAIKTGARHPVGNKEKSTRSRKSSERGKLMRDRKSSRECHEYDTPFDKSGRCHYHVNVQLATKKFSGGWHILFQVCPKCMEQTANTAMTKKKGTNGREETTLINRSSTRVSRGMGGGDASGQQFDDNGCCIVHSHVQVATKKLLGGGWKITGICPMCSGGSATGFLDDDAHSATSGKSYRSNTSRRSTRTAKTTATTREGSGKATKSGRYGALPFDSDGYCCRHPSVQIAQRKSKGGFKIVLDVCPDCVRDDKRSGGSISGDNARRSSRRRGSTRSRSKSRSSVRSRSLSQQRRRTHDGCSHRQPNFSINRRSSIASDVASFKQKLYSEFRM